VQGKGDLVGAEKPPGQGKPAILEKVLAPGAKAGILRAVS